MKNTTKEHHKQVHNVHHVGCPHCDGYSYRLTSLNLPDVTAACLVADGRVAVEKDPYGVGASNTTYEVTLTDVRHKDSGREIFISALPAGLVNELEERVLEDYLLECQL